MRWLAPISIWLLLASSVAPAQIPTELKIVTANAAPAEIATATQLQRLVAANEVGRWLFTTEVMIDQRAIPHSHPVLTLHARYTRDDDLLLSTFLHEQLHWFLDQRGAATEAAIAELRPLYPALPVGFPDGAADQNSSYLHLLVCMLEYEADRAVMGELRARQVMEYWAGHHYRRIYRAILDRPQPIIDALRKHGLFPPPARPAAR